MTSSVAADYVPQWRHQAGLKGVELCRNGWIIAHDPTQLAFAQQVDGERTIFRIAQRVAQTGLVGQDEGEQLDAAIDLFQQFWRTDFLSITLKTAG